MFNCQIFSRLAFGIKGCSSKTRFISSIHTANVIVFILAIDHVITMFGHVPASVVGINATGSIRYPFNQANNYLEKYNLSVLSNFKSYFGYNNKALTNVYQCFFGDKNAYFHDIFSVMACTHGGNFDSMTMFLTPVFSLIMHKICVNIHAFDILHVDLKMGLCSWNNIFVKETSLFSLQTWEHSLCDKCKQQYSANRDCWPS